MKLFKGHKNRVKKVTKFATKNKVFILMLTLALAFLLANFVFNQKNITPSEDTEIIEETETQTWRPEPGLRFYPIDLAILAVGGGFCTVMLIRERKKTKEELK